MSGGPRFCPAVVFVVGVGVAIWAWDIWGFPGGGFLGGSALGLRPWPVWGNCDSWVLFFPGGYMRRCWGCLCRRRRLPACSRTVPGLGPGGAWGSGGALPPGWGYGWAWGAWVLVGVAAGSMGWCMRLGPALVWGSSMHRVPLQGGGVSIEAGKWLYWVSYCLL